MLGLALHELLGLLRAHPTLVLLLRATTCRHGRRAWHAEGEGRNGRLGGHPKRAAQALADLEGLHSLGLALLLVQLPAMQGRRFSCHTCCLLLVLERRVRHRIPAPFEDARRPRHQHRPVLLGLVRGQDGRNLPDLVHGRIEENGRG